MESDDRIGLLLEEIRDDQRTLIEEYRRVANSALELQSDAVRRQKALGRLYKGALVAGGIIAIVIIVVIVYLLSLLSSYV